MTGPVNQLQTYNTECKQEVISGNTSETSSQLIITRLLGSVTGQESCHFKTKYNTMDSKSLLCGLFPKRDRNSPVPKKQKSSSRARRKHLPVGNGDYTVGCVDLMSDYCTNGIFVRILYPTNSTDIYVSIMWHFYV